MDLAPFVVSLRAELEAAAAAGPDEVAEAGARLTRALEPAVRLTLLDALGAAVTEVNAGLAARAGELTARPVIDIRLHQRLTEFVVELSTGDPDVPGTTTGIRDADTGHGTDSVGETPASEDTVARLTVRLPEAVKSRVERAATRSGLSVNAFITRALAEAVAGPGDGGDSGRGRDGRPRDDDRARRPGRGHHVQGWVR